MKIKWLVDCQMDLWQHPNYGQTMQRNVGDIDENVEVVGYGVTPSDLTSPEKNRPQLYFADGTVTMVTHRSWFKKLPDYSIFVMKTAFESDAFDIELHDLTKMGAMKIAMATLYKDGKLNPHIKVEIRNSKGIYFSANNP